MKQLLTAALVFGWASLASAQMLMRSEIIRGDKWSRTDNYLISLDTMPQIEYISTIWSYGLSAEHYVRFIMGDNIKWTLVDAASKPMKVKSMTDMCNLMYKLNWAYHSYSPGEGWIFKRRDLK